MSNLLENYPIGTTIEVPHPFTGKLDIARVINHYDGPPHQGDPKRITLGVVVRHSDGICQWIDGSYLDEDGDPITLSAAAELYPLAYPTLAQAAREGRIQARRSGRTWLTSRTAIEHAIKEGTLRPRDR